MKTTHLVTAIAVLFVSSTGAAQTLVWDGGGLLNNWANTLNWNPNALPGVGNDVIINQTVNSVLDSNFSVRGLDLSLGGNVDTNGYMLTAGVAGIDIGLASRLLVEPEQNGGTAVQTTGIMVGNLGTFDLAGGRVRVGGSVTTNLGGTFNGFGSLNFINGLANPTTIFTNDGSLTTGRAVGAAATDHFVLQIAADDPEARIDLDGTTNNRVVSLTENTTLNLDMRALDFRGTMTMNAGTVFDADDLFQTTSTSIMNINAATTTNGVADTATLRATNYNALNGSQLNINSGRLIMDAPFFFNPTSSISMGVASSVQFDQAGTIEGNLAIGNGSDVVVNDVVTIANAGFDMDGIFANNVDYFINAGGELTIDADHVDPGNGQYNGRLTLDGGIIDTNFANSDFVVGQSALVILDGASANPVVRGDRLEMQGSLRARGGNVPRTVAPVTFTAGSNSIVEANTDLFFIGPVTFEGGSTHTAILDGEFSFGGNITVDGATTIDMPNGNVQLDSNNANQTLAVNSDLTINAASLLSKVGGAGGGTYTINIDNSDSTLDVNLTSPSASWTLGADGFININGGGTLQTSIAGSDLAVEGRIEVNDNTRFDARVDLQSGAVVDVGSNTLHLNGGGFNDPNTIDGAFISGSGLLNAAGIRSLVGSGTINPDINFVAGADVRADGGTLVLNGDVVAADTLGVNSGGTLQVNNGLNTGNVTVLQLSGGTVRGGTITNDGTIRGHGLIETTGLNSLGTIAADGGELTIDTTNAPDLDSFGSTTSLEAIHGNLTVADALTDDFSGTATIAAGREMRFEGGWTQAIASDLFLNGNSVDPATLFATQSNFRGDIFVDGQAEIGGVFVFDAFSDVELLDTDDRLLLDNSGSILAGASFTGDGVVINDTSFLNIGDQARVDAVFANDGVLEVAANTVGEISFDVLDLLSGGVVRFGITGDNPGAYDVINFDTIATLGGTLAVTLDGFSPSAGDSFELIKSSTGAAVGTFDTTQLPALTGALRWIVNYRGDAVELLVTDMISGDFDANGDYACSDVDMLVAEIAAGTNNLAFDLTGDGSVDGNDLVAWLAEAGAAELVTGSPYLPADANLDGSVNGQDFVAWNSNKFTSTAAFCSGDFNADGFVNGQDFVIWNTHKFTSADGALASVPEPASSLGIGFGLALLVCRVRRR